MISTRVKNDVLKTLSECISQNESQILAANQRDVDAYQGDDISMLDRLKVSPVKVAAMADAVDDAIRLSDPQGKILYTHQPENGLRIENITVPFGKILIIYESRPDVTIEAAVTAFKAGNQILLKGGKEARNTNLILINLWHKALKLNGIPENFVTYLDMNRSQTQALIRENSHNVDLINPRGGDSLINFVRSNTHIPVIVSGRGNNFLFVDHAADFEMAINLILNGKSRISVCNALDKVILHSALPDFNNKVKKLVGALTSHNIAVHGDQNIASQIPSVHLETNNDILYEEFLDSKIMLMQVNDLYSAIEMINTYSGKHSASIVTDDKQHAHRFLSEVDCAAVYHNASTRFTDGGQFGFGAEMAISTQKVHFRGPIGIEQLVTNKWIIYGNGQIRP
jgi:glutamate-5-semialdehyde dehydrogenase